MCSKIGCTVRLAFYHDEMGPDFYSSESNMPCECKRVRTLYENTYSALCHSSVNVSAITDIIISFDFHSPFHYPHFPSTNSAALSHITSIRSFAPVPLPAPRYIQKSLASPFTSHHLFRVPTPPFFMTHKRTCSKRIDQ